MSLKNTMSKFRKNALWSNLFWLFFDKGYGAILTLFIYSLIGRYFGKEVFGIWNYMLAFGTIIPAFAGLGIHSILIKKLKETPNLKNIIVFNALFLRLFVGVFIAIIFFLIYYLIDLNAEPEYLGVVALIFLSQILLNANVFIYKNEADLNNKSTVIARNIALSIAFILRFYGIKAELELLFFALVNAIEYAIFFILSFLFYKIDKKNEVVVNLNPKISGYMIKQGLPLMLSSITVILYLKIDQFIIAFLLDNDSVGIYSAASRITEMLYAVPVLISSVFYPKILEEKNNPKKRQHTLLKLYGITISCAIFISMVVSFFSEYIIISLYGNDFRETIGILVVYSWSILFMSLLVSSSKLLLAIGRNDIILKRSVLGLLSNVGINFLLIPKYGVIGAAWSTLISYALAAYFSNIFFKDLRPVMIDQLKSMHYIFKGMFKNNVN